MFCFRGNLSSARDFPSSLGRMKLLDLYFFFYSLEKNLGINMPLTQLKLNIKPLKSTLRINYLYFLKNVFYYKIVSLTLKISYTTILTNITLPYISYYVT